MSVLKDYLKGIVLGSVMNTELMMKKAAGKVIPRNGQSSRKKGTCEWARLTALIWYMYMVTLGP